MVSPKMLFAMLSVLVLLQGCRIVIESPAEGFVLSDSGLYDCGIGETCTYEINGEPFSDVFTAVPAEGYLFTGWEESPVDGTLCKDRIVACVLLNVPASFTALAVDMYLVPGFELDTTQDSDGDGVPDGIDAFPNNAGESVDSDGDGLGDNADSFPNDPSLPVPNGDGNGGPGVTAYVAHTILYPGGAFSQLTDGTWVENNANGSNTFTEVGRDQWIVYLDDPSRDVEIRMDLSRYQIIYEDPDTTFVLYPISDVNPAVSTGWSLTQAVVSPDFFGAEHEIEAWIQLDAQTWMLVQDAGDGQNGVGGEFLEIARDATTVTLQNTNPGSPFYRKLDITTNELLFLQTLVGAAFRVGDITDSTPRDMEPASAIALREWRSPSSYFVATDPYSTTGPATWREIQGDGTEYTLNELFRAGSALYLFDPARGVNLWIDVVSNDIQSSVVFGQNWQPYSSTEEIPIQNPVAWYTFNNGTPDDSSGRDNHLTWGPGDVFPTTGVREEAAYFSGENSYATMPDGIVSTLDDFSISFFINFAEFERYSRAFEIGDDPNNQMLFVPDNTVGQNSESFFGITVNGESRFIRGSRAVGVTGRNGRLFQYNQGAFVQLSSSIWMHNSVSGSFEFTEVGRTDWTVELFDASRQFTVVLDFQSQRAELTNAQGVTYPIVYPPVSFTEQNPTGWAAARVRSGSVRYNQVRQGLWYASFAPSDNGQNTYALQEISRTASYVRIENPDSPEGYIELNMQNREILNCQPFFGCGTGIMTGIAEHGSVEPWYHVTITKKGDVARLYLNGGEIGRNENMTFSPSDLGVTTGNFIGKSSNSQVPLLKGAIDDFRIYNRALSRKEITTIATVDPSKIHFLGSDVELSRDELGVQLTAQGFVLVDDPPVRAHPTNPDLNLTQLDFRQCVTHYDPDNEADVAALDEEAPNRQYHGLLICNIDAADSPSGYGRSKTTVRAIYGGCEPVDQIPGAPSPNLDCEGGSFTGGIATEIAPGVYGEYEVQGPGAHVCSVLSTEKMCLDGGINLASVSYRIKNARGTGAGASVGVGVGLKAGGGYSDGVLTFGGDFRFGVGIGLELSLSDEDLDAVSPFWLGNLGPTGWKAIGRDIKAVGDKTLDQFNHLGNEVHDAGNDLVTGLESGGETIMVYIEDVGQDAETLFMDIEAGIQSAAQDIAGGIEDSANLVAQGAVPGTDTVVTYVGEAVTGVVDRCAQDYRNCLPAAYGGRL